MRRAVSVATARPKLRSHLAGSTGIRALDISTLRPCRSRAARCRPMRRRGTPLPGACGVPQPHRHAAASASARASTQYFAIRCRRGGGAARAAYRPLARLPTPEKAYRETGEYPATLSAFTAQCHASARPARRPLLLTYGPGDYNRLHQDLYATSTSDPDGRAVERARARLHRRRARATELKPRHAVARRGRAACAAAMPACFAVNHHRPREPAAITAPACARALSPGALGGTA